MVLSYNRVVHVNWPVLGWVREKKLGTNDDELQDVLELWQSFIPTTLHNTILYVTWNTLLEGTISPNPQIKVPEARKSLANANAIIVIIRRHIFMPQSWSSEQATFIITPQMLWVSEDYGGCVVTSKRCISCRRYNSRTSCACNMER